MLPPGGALYDGSGKQPLGRPYSAFSVYGPEIAPRADFSAYNEDMKPLGHTGLEDGCETVTASLDP